MNIKENNKSVEVSASYAYPLQQYFRLNRNLKLDSQGGRIMKVGHAENTYSKHTHCD